MTTDHLAKAKDYIAKGEDYYRKAAEEIELWLAEDRARTTSQVAAKLDKSERYVQRLRRARRTGEPVDWNSGSETTRAKRILRDPDERHRVLSELPAAELEAVRAEATEAVVANARAKRKEHDTEPTVGELTGGEKITPEDWIDTLILRANRTARELAKHPFVLGSMPVEEAIDYLNESERLIAEVRAAFQEQAYESVEV